MDAILVVDIQNDFLPGGALGVPDGDKVMPVVNRLMERFALILATQDWHPANHGSFGPLRPGVARRGLLRPASHKVLQQSFPEGVDPEIDSYSSFFDNRRKRSTGLVEYLRDQEVSRLFICGLATDYCVKFSALDSISSGFRTFVIEDACRGVDLKPGDSAAAIAEIRLAGATIVSSGSIG